jgi:hypothetical protein
MIHALAIAAFFFVQFNNDVWVLTTWQERPVEGVGVSYVWALEGFDGVCRIDGTPSSLYMSLLRCRLTDDSYEDLLARDGDEQGWMIVTHSADIADTFDALAFDAFLVANEYTFAGDVADVTNLDALVAIKSEIASQ